MHVQPGVPAHPQAREDGVVPEVLLEAVIRAVTQVFCGQQRSRQAPPAAQDGVRPDLPALLAPQQAADLMGVSRNTIDRMVQDGDLPSVVLREGTRQRMVRVPKSFVLQLLSDLGAGARISLREYAERWPASLTAQASTASPAGPQITAQPD
jgi:excisionase family DNA binding protein